MRKKNTDKAVQRADSRYDKRRAAAYGSMGSSSYVRLAEKLRSFAQWRGMRVQEPELFAKYIGLEGLSRLREECARECVTICMSAIRYDREAGKIEYSTKGLRKFADAVQTLAEGPKQKLHCLVLDLVSGNETIGDVAPKLAKRMRRKDDDDFRRRIRQVAAECGTPLKAAKRGRPRNQEQRGLSRS